MSLNTERRNDYDRSRRRGLILNLLHDSDPKPLDCDSLLHSLDFFNHPLTARGLAKDLQFLRGLGLIMIAEKELSRSEAARMLNRYAELSDGENLSISITVAGSDFQEGRKTIDGILRIK